METVITIVVRAALMLAAFTFAACVIALAIFGATCATDAIKCFFNSVKEDEDRQDEEV